MKTNVVFVVVVSSLLFSAAIDGVHGSNWTWIMSEEGSIERIDLDEDPVDSESTLLELKEDVLFVSFTKSNPQESETLYLQDDDSLDSSYFDPLKPTRILIHGWHNTAENGACVDIRDAYLNQGDYNVICVDWGSYAANTYIYARTKIVTVGEYVGLMIDYLETKGMNLADLIVVGHSLGAHIAGVASRSATNNVATLIALDPAAPLFNIWGATARLRSTDADFTQVIHTNTALLGHGSQLGVVDIWPNGGAWQAGCDFDVFGSCSHARSCEFFIESIADSDVANKFTAHACDNYDDYVAEKCSDNVSTYLGGSLIDRNANAGNYYLTTNHESPYSMG